MRLNGQLSLPVCDAESWENTNPPSAGSDLFDVTRDVSITGGFHYICLGIMLLPKSLHVCVIKSESLSQLITWCPHVGHHAL